MKDSELEKLRGNYLLVRNWWRKADGWTEADLQEADAGIRKAIDSGDDELIACWVSWIEKKAIQIQVFTGKVREMENRILEQTKAEQLEECHG
jgi:hypothetical protein